MSELESKIDTIFKKKREEIESSFSKIKKASFNMGRLQALLELKTTLIDELDKKIAEFEKRKLEEISSMEKNTKNIEEYKAKVKEIELRISELEYYIDKMKELSNIVEKKIEIEINKILEVE